MRVNVKFALAEYVGSRRSREQLRVRSLDRPGRARAGRVCQRPIDRARGERVRADCQVRVACGRGAVAPAGVVEVALERRVVVVGGQREGRARRVSRAAGTTRRSRLESLDHPGTAGATHDHPAADRLHLERVQAIGQRVVAHRRRARGCSGAVETALERDGVARRREPERRARRQCDVLRRARDRHGRIGTGRIRKDVKAASGEVVEARTVRAEREHSRVTEYPGLDQRLGSFPEDVDGRRTAEAVDPARDIRTAGARRDGRAVAGFVVVLPFA